MLTHCNVICSFILVCYLKVLMLTVVCILSSCKTLFTAWSAFSLPGIPVWVRIQLIDDICVDLDVASLMTLVLVLSPVSNCLVCLQLSKSICVL